MIKWKQCLIHFDWLFFVYECEFVIIKWSDLNVFKWRKTKKKINMAFVIILYKNDIEKSHWTVLIIFLKLSKPLCDSEMPYYSKRYKNGINIDCFEYISLPTNHKVLNKFFWTCLAKFRTTFILKYSSNRADEFFVCIFYLTKKYFLKLERH